MVVYSKKDNYKTNANEFGRSPVKPDEMVAWNWDGNEFSDDIGGMTDTEGHPQNRG
jgi:hypothetical protein